MTFKTLISSAVLVAVLSGCTSAREQALNRQSSAAVRTLERIGTVGDPGRVAAADFALARRAREEGQWTAFADAAAPGAMLHGPGGPILAGPWLGSQENPEQADLWGPNTVWSSCDGTLAITFGRFQDPEGRVGSYATAWELQNDRSYRWIYDLGGHDDPQPPPPENPDIPEGAIVVPGLTSINGMVADCPRRGEVVSNAMMQPEPGVDFGTKSAADGTLSYRWEHEPDGQRRVVVQWLREGEWQTALDFLAPPLIMEE